MFMHAASDASDRDRAINPGDLGRRITLRREQLGLSRTATATRAGMAEEYLEYLETSPTAVDIGPLLRLAVALETSADQLLGGGLDLPPGRAAAAARPRLEELAAAECWARLAPGGIGRVALTTPDGPIVLPVNFRVLDGAVLFRTGVDGPLAAAVGNRVAVEVDRVDEAMRTGWSILVVGEGTRLADRAAAELLRHRGGPDPWAGGDRELWVRVEPAAVTGRTVTTSDDSTESAGTERSR
ncbi:helix-turn-helix domain-containing protein [Kitasatospora paracochleata]|uniref:HTH cro/C1-type domain-containing protein n=2 Tax=Kitasatospora paracochleata TaxID=58354 RepID=A0ABT1J1V5_9ACTN|nr:pyridoxamine 5'-phosphate oxidase family protein [Kitasatospora paracochleata]MCP2311409.1 hypothetical protein [Kitasatospora paracochleata]